MFLCALADEMGSMTRRIKVSTYNVHRWMGASGRNAPDIRVAGAVISEIGADLIALQEVLRPVSGEDPLRELAEDLGLQYLFTRARIHRRGELGNVILSRWPIRFATPLRLSSSLLDKRVATLAQVEVEDCLPLQVVTTHLSLLARMRHRQVDTILEHLRDVPTILLGDFNLWRRCKASHTLESELARERYMTSPSSYPGIMPFFALDRVYSRGVPILDMRVHNTPLARRASDHLPVIAEIELGALAAA